MGVFYARFLNVTERLASALLLVVAVVFFIDVVLRYVVGVSYSWIVELEWYLSSIAIALSYAAAMRADKHVRVDVFRERMSPVLKHWIDRIGHLMLLLPWTVFLVYAGWIYASNSFAIGEGSADPGGLPFRYLPKYAVVFGMVLLAIEGLRQVVQRRLP